MGKKKARKLKKRLKKHEAMHRKILRELLLERTINGEHVEHSVVSPVNELLTTREEDMHRLFNMACDVATNEMLRCAGIIDNALDP